ncbi:zinc finger, C3HC4 type (RING finger) domain-containing protein [Cryptosporidium felis]|nr:zinc finger, C3HC4 type (RING finger) domain-containing protein [Cryptosporidium felis]
MESRPTLTDKGFYKRFPTYKALLSSVDIPKGLRAFEVLCPKRKLAKGKQEGGSEHELSDLILSRVTTLGENDLYSDFNCLICFRILQRTMVVKDCLHRFCGECIEKCVRIGLRECPQCRLHIASRRSLRSDSIMDTLTFRLFPNASEFEKKYQEILVSNNKRQHSSISEPLSPSASEIPKKSKEDSDPAGLCKDDIIGVLLKPLPGNAEQFRMKSNALTFNLRLPAHARVNYLKQFLLGKLRRERPSSRFQVSLESVQDLPQAEEVSDFTEPDLEIGELAKDSKEGGIHEYRDMLSIFFKVTRAD